MTEDVSGFGAVRGACQRDVPQHFSRFGAKGDAARHTGGSVAFFARDASHTTNCCHHWCRGNLEGRVPGLARNLR